MFVIEVREPKDAANVAPDGPWAGWRDLSEGPFWTREDAEEFARAEVGVPYRVKARPARSWYYLIVSDGRVFSGHRHAVARKDVMAILKADYGKFQVVKLK